MKYLKIKKNGDFSRIFSKGKRCFAESLSVIYFPSDKLRMGVCVSKKHGKAVVRNRVKRLVRAVFIGEKRNIRGVSVLILPKVAKEYSYSLFKRDIEYIFKKENLYVK